MSDLPSLDLEMKTLGPKNKVLRWILHTPYGNITVCSIAFLIAFFVPLFSGLFYSVWSTSLFLPAINGSLIAIMWFSLNFGSPMKWWIPFSENTMTVDLWTKIQDSSDVHLWGDEVAEKEEHLRKEMDEWLQTTCKNSYIWVNRGKIKFRKKGHMALYKLAWA